MNPPHSPLQGGKGSLEIHAFCAAFTTKASKNGSFRPSSPWVGRYNANSMRVSRSFQIMGLLAVTLAAASCRTSKRRPGDRIDAYRPNDTAAGNEAVWESTERTAVEPCSVEGWTALQALVRGVGREAVDAACAEDPEQLNRIVRTIEFLDVEGFTYVGDLVGWEKLGEKLTSDTRGVGDVLEAISALGLANFRTFVNQMGREAVSKSFHNGHWSFGYFFACQVTYLEELSLMSSEDFSEIVGLLDKTVLENDPRGFGDLLKQVRIMGTAGFKELHAWMGPTVAVAVGAINNVGMSTFRDFVATFGRDATIRGAGSGDLRDALRSFDAIGPKEFKEFMRLLGRGPGFSDLARDMEELTRLLVQIKAEGLPRFRALVVRLQETIGAEAVTRGLTHCQTCFFAPFRRIEFTGGYRYVELVRRVRDAVGREAAALSFSKSATYFSDVVVEVRRLGPGVFEDVVAMIGTEAAGKGLASGGRAFNRVLREIRLLDTWRFRELVKLLGRDAVGRAVAERPNEFAKMLAAIRKDGVDRFAQTVAGVGELAAACGFSRRIWFGNILIEAAVLDVEQFNNLHTLLNDTKILNLLGEYRSVHSVWNARGDLEKLERFGTREYSAFVDLVGPRAVAATLTYNTKAFIASLEGSRHGPGAANLSGRDAYLLAFLAVCDADDDFAIRRMPVVVQNAEVSDRVKRKALQFLLNAVRHGHVLAAGRLQELVPFLANEVVAGGAVRRIVTEALGEAGKQNDVAVKVLASVVRDPHLSGEARRGCFAALGVAGRGNEKAVSALSDLAANAGGRVPEPTARGLREGALEALRKAAEENEAGVEAVMRLIEAEGNGEDAVGVLLDLIDRGVPHATVRILQTDWAPGVRDFIRRELPEIFTRRLQDLSGGTSAETFVKVFADPKTQQWARYAMVRALGRTRREADDIASIHERIVKPLRQTFQQRISEDPTGDLTVQILAFLAEWITPESTGDFDRIATLLAAAVERRTTEILFDGLRVLKALVRHGSEAAYQALGNLGISTSAGTFPVLQDLLVDPGISDATKFEILELFGMLLVREPNAEIEGLLQEIGDGTDLIAGKARRVLRSVQVSAGDEGKKTSHGYHESKVHRAPARF